MFTAKSAFGSFSVDDLEKAKEFYISVLGLTADEDVGLTVGLPGGGTIFIYDKENHEPATFTVLNLVVDDIDQAVEELKGRGVQFEHYPEMQQDDKNIARGLAKDGTWDMAWFKDPAGNILSVIQQG